MEQIESTDRIPVYDVKGNKLDEIRLPERIMPIPTRRGGFSAKGIYYKGSGIVYRNHLSDKEQMQMTDGEQVIGKTGLVYEKYLACYPPLVHKFGVFLFPHQPVFTDCEGGCGKKEKRLVDNQKDFAYSAIEEIVDVIPISIPEHCIYAYRLKNVKGGIEDTIGWGGLVRIGQTGTQAWHGVCAAQFPVPGGCVAVCAITLTVFRGIPFRQVHDSVLQCGAGKAVLSGTAHGGKAGYHVFRYRDI